MIRDAIKGTQVRYFEAMRAGDVDKMSREYARIEVLIRAQNNRRATKRALAHAGVR